MLALGLILILVVMIVPMPPFLMDLLLTLDIALGLMVLVVVLYTTEPLQFSVFPGLLLMVTLFRLVAECGLHAPDPQLRAMPGRVIEAFGNFVVGGNYVVGIIIFAILVIINFVVLTKGAGRIAEVAARFTLDKMPGKQMAIDADLNNGLIDEREARAAPARRSTRKPNFTGHGRRGQVRAGRCHRRPPDHFHQHPRRLRDRHGPARDGVSPTRSRPTPCSLWAMVWSARSRPW